MDRLLAGVAKFQEIIFKQKQSLFEILAHEQHPRTLFITCSDSRLDPALITQTEPGELFVLRNAGNIIPPHNAANGGEEASIEYAVTVLKVEHIVVCGHSNCGAIQHLLHPDGHESSVLLRWLSHTAATKEITDAQHLRDSEEMTCAVRTNVIVQLRHLKTYPCVAREMSLGRLSIHGWYYCLETGSFEIFDPQSQLFHPLNTDPQLAAFEMACIGST
jgi:carbonic anhydrase